MPTRELLSPAQRVQFTTLPALSERDLARYDTLSAEGLAAVNRRRVEHYGGPGLEGDPRRRHGGLNWRLRLQQQHGGLADGRGGPPQALGRKPGVCPRDDPI